MEFKDIEDFLSKISDFYINTGMPGNSAYTDLTSYLEEISKRPVFNYKYYNWNIFSEVEFKNIKFI